MIGIISTHGAYVSVYLVTVSEYPSLPELPEVNLERKANATASGPDDFSVFSLSCEVHAAKGTNVNYELQWVVNGAISKTDAFKSMDVKDGKLESTLPGESLKSFQKIDQVSEHFFGNLVNYWELRHGPKTL